MPATRVITRARNAYTAEFRSHSKMVSPWKLVSASQLCRRACHDPKDNGLALTSCGAVFVAAGSSHRTGTMKKTAKAASSSPTNRWPVARAGLGRRRDLARTRAGATRSEERRGGKEG